MNNDKYTCEMCGGTFEKGRSDEEAKAEMKEYFGEVPDEGQAIVCDDCFNKIHPAKFPMAVTVSNMSR